MPPPAQMLPSAAPVSSHDESNDPSPNVSKDMDNEPSDEVPPCAFDFPACCRYSLKNEALCSLIVDIISGGLSERKLLDMMLDANFDFSGAFKNDVVLLRKAHGVSVFSLVFFNIFLVEGVD